MSYCISSTHRSYRAAPKASFEIHSSRNGFKGNQPHAVGNQKNPRKVQNSPGQKRHRGSSSNHPVAEIVGFDLYVMCGCPNK